MTRYKLQIEEAEVPAEQRTEISLKDLLDLGIKHQISFMLKNSNAVQKSIKVIGKWTRKFRLSWKDKTNDLYCAKSFIVFINDKGMIIAKGISGVKVTEKPESLKAHSSKFFS